MFLCCYNKLMSTKIMFLLHISKRGTLIGHNMLLENSPVKGVLHGNYRLGGRLGNFLFVGGFAWLMNVSYIRQSIIRCQADG